MPDHVSHLEHDLGLNPQQAQASRIALFKRFVGSDTLIIGSHFTDPGIGLLRHSTAGYYLSPATL